MLVLQTLWLCDSNLSSGALCELAAAVGQPLSVLTALNISGACAVLCVVANECVADMYDVFAVVGNEVSVEAASALGQALAHHSSLTSLIARAKPVRAVNWLCIVCRLTCACCGARMQYACALR